MQWREFPGLGTEIIITIESAGDQTDVLNKAQETILDFDRRFSRFIAGNELTSLNNSLETELPVSQMMGEMLYLAKLFNTKTQGIFEPTIIDNLEALGYDRSFDQIKKEMEPGKGKGKGAPDKTIKTDPDLKELSRSFQHKSKISELEIHGQIIRRPQGLRIDLGGIGKGFIVDELSKNLLAPLNNYWLSAGGDILAVGHPKNKTGWDIVVQNPYDPEKNIYTLNTLGKKLGIATSGIIKRTSRSANHQWHHLIDPRSGLPADNDILSVTVISSSATKADIYAKTILILGKKEGLEFIEKEIDSAAIIFTKDRQPIISERAKIYLKNYEN